MNHLVRLSSFTVIASLVGALTNVSPARANGAACYLDLKVQGGRYAWAEGPSPVLCLRGASVKHCIELRSDGEHEKAASPVPVEAGLSTSRNHLTRRHHDAEHRWIGGGIEICNVLAGTNRDCPTQYLDDVRADDCLTPHPARPELCRLPVEDFAWDVTEDGSSLVVVRSPIKARRGAVIEVYDLYHGKRVSRRTIGATKQTAEVEKWDATLRVVTVGKYAYVGNADGTAIRIEPFSDTPVLAGEITPFRMGKTLQIADKRVAMLEGSGRAAYVLDGVAKKDRVIALPAITNGDFVNLVPFASGDDLYIAYESSKASGEYAPWDGTVVQLSLKTGTVVGRRSLVCKGTK